MSRFTKFVSLALVLLMVLSMVGMTAIAGEKTTVLFWDMVSGNENYPAIAAEHAKKISETYPNIEINYQSIPWANRYETFTTAIAAGEAPDFSNGGGYQSFQFYEMGEIMNITPVVDRWKENGILDNYNMDLINYFKVGDAQVGIPIGFDLRLMIYRKDWFDAAGLPAPKSWDDIYEAAKKFTDPANGVYGLVYPCAGADGNVLFMNWLAMNGSGVWKEDGSNADWNNPKNVEVVEFIRKLQSEKLIPEGMSAYGNAEVIQMCSQDKAAMAIITAGNAGAQIANANDGYGKWALLAPPAGPSANGNNAFVGAMNAFMAYKQTKHPQETMDALSWWCENYIDLYLNKDTGTGGCPARIDWQNDEKFLSTMADPFARDYLTGGFMPKTHTLIYPATNIGGWLVQNAFDSERWWSRVSQAILTETTPADQLLQGMQDEAEALIAEFAAN